VGSELEPIPCAQILGSQRACRHLDHGECPERARDAAGRHRTSDFHHRAVAAREHDIDRKAHEKGVYEVRRRDRERVARRKARPSEQTALSRGAVEGPFDMRRQRASRPQVRQLMVRRRLPEERSEKVAFQNASTATSGAGR
jgi:hypothetical protein